MGKKQKKKKAVNQSPQVNVTGIEEIINSLKETPIHDLETQISDIMEQSGLFCRIFSRQKSGASAARKIKAKKETQGNDYKMQDLFGIRIALYFKDDIPICREIIQNYFKIVDISEDKETTTNFAPKRLNLVCEIPEALCKEVRKDLWDRCSVDKTFEIQIRTVFSEGWHEIDHDLRYKCKDEWKEDDDDMSRALNGILATLETCNWSIISLFDQLAYQKYTSGDWKAMLRNKFRIRMTEENLSEKIIKIFDADEDKRVAKQFYKVDREKLINAMSFYGFETIPKTMDNIVYVANALFVKNQKIKDKTPKELGNKIKRYVPQYEIAEREKREQREKEQCKEEIDNTAEKNKDN